MWLVQNYPTGDGASTIERVNDPSAYCLGLYSHCTQVLGGLDSRAAQEYSLAINATTNRRRATSLSTQTA